MIGDTLKKLRVRAGLTQEQIAADPDFGVNANTLASYEKNVREPKLSTLVKLAQYFGVTTDYLLGLSEYETSEKEITGKTIQLSNEALEFLGSCNHDQLITVSQILSAPHAGNFLDAFFCYLGNSCILDADGRVSEIFQPLVDRLNRPVTDAEFADFMEYWGWNKLADAIKAVVSDIFEQTDLERRTREGRPKRGKYKKKASADEAEAVNQGSANDGNSD